MWYTLKVKIRRIVYEENQRFAAPLPEFYKRRIIFWYYIDGEFQDRLDEVTLNNAKPGLYKDSAIRFAG